MPRISLAPVQPIWRWLGVRLGGPTIIVLTIMVVGGLVSRRAGLIGLAFIVLGIVVAIVSVEVLLVLRTIDRRQDRLLAASPAGTLFAAPATPVNPTVRITGAPPQRTARRDRGLLRIDRTGAMFVPDRAPHAQVGLAWNQVSTIAVTPRTPFIAELELAGGYGQTRRWRVTGLPRLTDALTQLQQQWSHGAK